MKTLFRLFTGTVAAGCLVAICGYFFMLSTQEGKVLNEHARLAAPGKFIPLKYGKVHYQFHGHDSADLVVLIHGGGITGMEVWEKNIQSLVEQGFRVLTFDLYGRGYSSRPKVKNTPELFASQLSELLDSLHVENPFHIVAMSMGALVAFEYAKENSEMIKKVALIDPAATGNYRINFLMRLPIVSNFLLTVVWYPKAIENQRKEFVNEQLFEKYSERLSYFMEFDGYKYTNYSTWRNMLNQNRLDSFKSNHEIPFLLVYGSKDPFFNSKEAERYKASIPNLRVEKINDAGHMPHYEKPALVNPILYEFLLDSST